MNHFDLVPIEIPVDVGGRRFTVRRVRLRDVLAALVRFDDELRKFVTAGKPDASALLGSIAGDDLADLFSFSLDPCGPEDKMHLRRSIASNVNDEPEAVNGKSRLTTILAMHIGSVNDLQRIWDSISLAPPEAPAQLPAGQNLREPYVPPLLAVIDLVANRYGISPLQVVEWPYEAFLSLTELIDARIQKISVRSALEAVGLDEDFLDDSAIRPGPMPDFNRVN